MNLTAKEKKMRARSMEQHKQIDYESAVKTGGEVKTWSATHTPAYGIQPVEQHKICLCCRKQWPADTDQTNCDCVAGGRLYSVGGRATADGSECAEEHRQLVEWLKELKQFRWIPVEERLPEEFKEVLISDRNYVGYGYYRGNPGSSGWGDIIADRGTTVSAWMPLPEPYKPES